MMKNKIFIAAGMILAIIMFIIWATMLSGENSQRVWHAFLINFLFFTSAGGGLVVVPAVIMSAHGTWMRNYERFCWAGLSFSLPSIVALIILWVGSETWAPWIDAYPEKQWWLDNTFLFSRNIISLTFFWIMAFVFYSKRYSSKNRIYARWFALVFVVSFSLIGFDFVMALMPEWYSMMIGGYFFITAIYTAVAAWIMLTLLLDKPETARLQDMGKLLIALCMFSSYLMFSHLFPIWYAHNPLEMSFLIPRMNYEWKWIGYVLLLIVYLGPIAFLLPAKVKRTPQLIWPVAAMIFSGMWIERWWLVSAVFNKETITFGWPEIISTLAFAGLFFAGLLVSLNFIPKHFETENRTL